MRQAKKRYITVPSGGEVTEMERRPLRPHQRGLIEQCAQTKGARFAWSWAMASYGPTSADLLGVLGPFGIE